MSEFTNLTVYVVKFCRRIVFAEKKISFNNLFFVIYFAGDSKLSGSSFLSNG